MNAIWNLMPDRLLPEIQRIPMERAEEIRFRNHFPVSCIVDGKELVSATTAISTADLEHMVLAASRHSIYAVNDCIREGYLVLQGGHRMGICGQAVILNGEVKTIREFSSVSLRIARDIGNICTPVRGSTLILGPPGSGKTTLLRDCIRFLSDNGKQRVSLVDERGEVAACFLGNPQMRIGKRTDVLSGCPKSLGITMLLRSMNPQWIAVDEITKSSDVTAMVEASYCGVRFLATAHAWDKADLERRPVYRQLCQSGVFDELYILRPDHTFAVERMV